MKAPEQVVFAIAPAGRDGKFTILIGVPHAGWEYMKDGMAHDFDLSGVGLPIKMLLWGGKDRAAIMATIQKMVGVRERGEQLVDMTNKDMSIKTGDPFSIMAEALLKENVGGNVLDRDTRAMLTGLIAGALAETFKMGREAGPEQ